MVSNTTHDEEAHRKEIDELVTSEPLRIPPASKEKDEGEASSSISDSNGKAGEVPQLSQWNSTDDHQNPKNWSTWKKVFHTAVPALYGFVM